MADKETISHSELLRILDYNPNTGIFTWKNNVGNRTRIGHKAGRICGNGYCSITYQGRSYLAHRAAYLARAKAIHGDFARAA